MMIRFLFLFWICAWGTLSAQLRRIVLVDSLELSPLPNAHARDPASGHVWVSNTDGGVNLPPDIGRLEVSHIGYKGTSIELNEYKGDTLVLAPAEIRLGELTLFPNDPERVLRRFLSTLKVEYRPEVYTYRERYVVDSITRRLFQVRLFVEKKSGHWNPGRSWKRQLRVIGLSQDYRSVSVDTTMPGTGFLPNQILAGFLYPGTALNVFMRPGNVWTWRRGEGLGDHGRIEFELVPPGISFPRPVLTGYLNFPLGQKGLYELVFAVDYPERSTLEKSVSGKPFERRLHGQRTQLLARYDGYRSQLARLSFAETGCIQSGNRKNFYSLEMGLVNHGLHISRRSGGLRLHDRSPWHAQFNFQSPGGSLWPVPRETGVSESNPQSKPVQ